MKTDIAKINADKKYRKFLKKVDAEGKKIYGVREWNKIKKEDANKGDNQCKPR